MISSCPSLPCQARPPNCLAALRFTPKNDPNSQVRGVGHVANATELRHFGQELDRQQAGLAGALILEWSMLADMETPLLPW